VATVTPPGFFPYPSQQRLAYMARHNPLEEAGFWDEGSSAPGGCVTKGYFIEQDRTAPGFAPRQPMLQR
jgi:hypothetical protein